MGKARWPGRGRVRKDEYGIREEYISNKVVILGFTGDLIIYGIPGQLSISRALRVFSLQIV